MLRLIKKYLQLISFVGVLALLFFNLINWKIQWLGWLFFILYLLIVGEWWQEILKNIFGFNRKSWTTKIFGWFSAFSLLTLISAVVVVFYTLSSVLVWWCYLIAGVVTFLIWLLAIRKSVRVESEVQSLKSEVSDNYILFGKSRVTYHISLIIYIILWCVAFYLLYHSQSTAALNSPWQTINKYYLPIFFVLTFISGLFLFVKTKTKTILLVIVLQGLLMHLYLPLSHQLPWGGDVWRHVANENRLQQSDLILPVLFGEQAQWKEIAKINLPEAFLISNKYTYGHLWGTSVLLADTLQVNLLDINKWLEPILWSLTVPFILFRLGWLLFDNRRQGLWLAWLALLPFPLQALGALTLPVGFDLILFLFVLMLWLHYLRDNSKYQKRLILFFACLMVFGYSLYFILIWIVIILSRIAYYLLSINNQETRYKQYSISNIQYSIFSKAFWTILVFLSFFIFPAIELVSKISFVPNNLNLILNLKQLLGQFSGWFYASAIRPHDILSGNIIFNHTPDFAFVANIFNEWRWWLIPAMIVVWFFVSVGIVRILKSYVLGLKSVGLLFSTVFGGYLLGWYVLDGDRLFTRRLDAILAVLILVLFIYGISHLLSLISHFKKSPFTNHRSLTKIFVVFILLCFSWFITFTYASGPDVKVVSDDEFNAANLILSPKSEVRSPFCVLADAWVLLPLEAFTNGAIVGGGFPIDYNFAQPELTVLYSEMQRDPRASILKLAHEKTGAERCWYVVEVESLKSPLKGIRPLADIKSKVSEVFGSEPLVIGDLLVWRETITATLKTDLKKGKK